MNIKTGTISSEELGINENALIKELEEDEKRKFLDSDIGRDITQVMVDGHINTFYLDLTKVRCRMYLDKDTLTLSVVKN